MTTLLSMINDDAKKILIIDDEVDILNVVELILKSNGYEVFTHPNGLHVTEIVKRHNPDLILLDVQLSGLSGTHICRELKKTTNIPVVLFSAHADLKKTYHECNADAFISKPFDIPDLLNVISERLNKRA